MKPLDPFYTNVPEKAFVVINGATIGVGCVTRGYRGYSSVYDYTPKPDSALSRQEAIECAQDCVDRYNLALGITKAQGEACLFGSMFGWHIPGANPGNYSDDGKPLKP